ncbi:MAG: hypothetical protein AAGF59_10925 [Pseudomonadota bacterium]
MIRNALISLLLLAVLIGPFIAIGASALSNQAAQNGSKAMCLIAGIGCADGPIVLSSLGFAS